ncbi:MAG: hypothetical protein KC996_05170 [Phycisphaerales bacterium]|nr:hypothetical protein [Phycisphaerales bacterium]
MKPRFALFAALISTACTTSLLADEPIIVDCVAPPQGASEAAVKCYTAACDKLIQDLAACEGSQACRLAAYAVYHNSIALCLPLMTAPESETSDDLVIWLDTESGNWEVSWPGEEIQAFTPRFDFNI